MSGPMRQATGVLRIDTPGRALIDFTRDLAAWVADQDIENGLLTLLCRHTSASLTIQENAAREVRSDLIAWLDRVAPENGPYLHDDEGPDDMPAHIKAMLTGVTLSIPVIGGRMALGTWQGVYLIEHRRAAHHRTVALHLIGA